MTDWRLKENRSVFFSDLYAFNLEHRVMPGLVYLYLPELVKRKDWGVDEKLWFAFLNGLTQNPITSLRIFNRLPQVPPASATLFGLEKWFDDEWDTLQFDTDRRYQKKDTLQAIRAYARAVEHFGSQEKMLTGKTYAELWAIVQEHYYSFGRLSAFSYLEYVHIMGAGADCDDLMFSDKSGSKSHRNGMLFLRQLDSLVWDKRIDNGCTGEYTDFKGMCRWLTSASKLFLEEFRAYNPTLSYAGNFTLESNLCTFKNHFFGRRYPGVYADMAQDRIEWADERAGSAHTEVFKAVRSECLPEWLRVECEPEKRRVVDTAKIFPQTGQLLRLEFYKPERYAQHN